jgi:hypothetical protein
VNAPTLKYSAGEVTQEQIGRRAQQFHADAVGIAFSGSFQ